jgi:hypothetical protein
MAIAFRQASGPATARLRRSAPRPVPPPDLQPPDQQPPDQQRPQARGPKAPRTRVAVSASFLRVLAVAYTAAWMTCVLVQPVADGPAPVVPAWEMVVAFAAVGLFFATAVTLGMGRWSGLGVAAANGVAMLGETIACPAVGHHVIAWWWFVQLGLSLAVLASAVALLAGTRPAR